ncbi:D-alanyl-D-alanine carboxypeptidase [Ferruginibacter sp. SUN002]|uniref:D-alanyl-D-alanine carboxypeptidase n=1 Tax=Ferruginibacter sp. SUN002 TaxID=2937789 RepID=UPI003D3679E7
MRALFSKVFFFFQFSLFIFSYPASAQSVKKIAKNLLQDSIISTGNIGISIYEPATDEYWYEYNATKNFIPASNTKLFSLYAGMKYLGDSLISGYYKEDEKGLKFIGNADPTFLHPEFKNHPAYNFLKNYSGKKITLFERMPIYRSKSRFQPLGIGWAWDDYNSSYMTERNFFPIYGNLATFSLNNNKVTVTPGFFSKKMFQYSKTLNSFFVERMQYSNFFFINEDSLNNTTADIPFKTGCQENIVSMEDSLLTDTLHRLVDYGKITLVSLDGYTKIHSQTSDSLFKPMMHNSDNFFAEQTLLMVSNEKLGYMSDEDIIDTLLNNDLKDIPQKPRWVDGSGLSRYNLFTPRSFVYILNKMKNEFGLERLKDILPAGGEGTLKNYYLSDSPYIYAKTGSMSNQSTISGFLFTKKNKLLIFSVLVNNFQGKTASVRKSVEQFLVTIRNKH